MSKIPFLGNIINARFTNNNNTDIEVLFEKNGKQRVYYVAVDHNDPKFLSIINNGWDLDKISQATIAWRKSQTLSMRKIIQQHIQNTDKDDIDTSLKASDIVNSIMESDSEVLINLKFAIFELPIVKQTKGRPQKAKIRNADTILKCIMALGELLDK